jgi:hypothetical protein
MSKLLAILAVFVLRCAAEPITIVAADSLAQPSDVVGEMRREVERLLAPADLTVDWRSGVAKGEHFARLLVIAFRGDCAPEPLYRSGIEDAQTKRLAWTAVTDDSVLPYATVECVSLRRSLHQGLSSNSSGLRSKLMGRAMGRIIAHEVYHILTKTRRHATSGASKACFGVPDLTADRFSFDSLTLAQMRPSVPAVTDLPPAAGEYESGR